MRVQFTPGWVQRGFKRLTASEMIYAHGLKWTHPKQTPTNVNTTRAIPKANANNTQAIPKQTPTLPKQYPSKRQRYPTTQHQIKRQQYPKHTLIIPIIAAMLSDEASLPCMLALLQHYQYVIRILPLSVRTDAGTSVETAIISVA